jgi:hypothetical protein
MPARSTVLVLGLTISLASLAALPVSGQAPEGDPTVLCAFEPGWAVPAGARKPGACPPAPDEDEGIVRLGDRLVVRVAGLDALLAEERKRLDDLRLFVDGVEIPKLPPVAVQRAAGAEGRNDVRFELERTADNRDAWRSLLGPFRLHARETTVGIGIAGGQEIAGSSETAVELQPVREKRFWGWVALLAVVLIVFFWLPLPGGGRLADSLRDRQVGAASPGERPFSLARCQMAFWFFLVVSAFVFLWMVLSDLDTLTGSVLTLMGIGSGTALGAAMIDRGKQADLEAADAAQEAATQAVDAAPPEAKLEALTAQQTAVKKKEQLRGAVKRPRANRPGVFLSDLLADGNGYSFHRFQILVWTLVLGIIFVASVWKDLAMPQFSETLLGLMGISAGTYLGFKFPERHEPEA